jgi:mycothiol synthase
VSERDATSTDAGDVRRVAEWGPDAEAVVRGVIDAAEEADGSAPVDEAVHLMLDHHGLDHAALWLAGQDAFALAHRQPDDDETHPAHLELVTAPAARDRGLGGALASAALETRPSPWAAWSHGNHPAAARLAARLGFEATRSLWVMRLAAGDGVPPRGAPEGVTLRSFRPGDEPGILAVNAMAFADHPEQGTLDMAGFDERAASSWFDPQGLIVAERDGEVVGFHWTKTHDGDPPHGEVYVIGVARSEQGSGLGASLLAAGIDHLRSRGLGEVVLYVESDNPATRLYERVGFTHAAEDTHVQYTRS